MADPPPDLASPPCARHALDPGYAADAHWRAWRRAERARLIALRLAIPSGARAAQDAALADRLDAVVGDPAGRTVAICWPFRGEPDLRGWAARARARGAAVALPVVVAKDAPLAFRLWDEGARLERGVWNIPVPAEGAEIEPDVVTAPVVGFDAARFRLGYGGGYFDRTLARRRPALVVGVGHDEAEIPTIRPQPHDVVLDLVATPTRVVEPGGLHGASP
jgi:5,10-methenyltetrahydrofolate synthetase